MARKGMSGQLNMFDFFSSLESGVPGEVEMVSLVPSYDEEPEIVEVPEPEPVPEVVEVPEPEPTPVVRATEQVAMSRSYEKNGMRIEIAYINYNKVRITKGEEIPIIIEFASTKEAVDYYVEQMQELEADE